MLAFIAWSVKAIRLGEYVGVDGDEAHVKAGVGGVVGILAVHVLEQIVHVAAQQLPR